MHLVDLAAIWLDKIYDTANYRVDSVLGFKNTNIWLEDFNTAAPLQKGCQEQTTG